MKFDKEYTEHWSSALNKSVDVTLENQLSKPATTAAAKAGYEGAKEFFELIGVDWK